MIIMLVPIAFMQSMSAYVAQNYGAGRMDRAVKGLRIAIAVSVAFGAVTGSLAFFRGDLLCSVFARDDGVIAAGFEYLRAYGIDCLLTSFLFCFVGYFNGLGKTGFVMLEGIVSAFAVRIPIAYFMSIRYGTLFAIGLSVPLSTLSQIIMCFIYFAILRRKDRNAPVDALPD
jgi:Na+-driven multidrug efflux pump